MRSNMKKKRREDTFELVLDDEGDPTSTRGGHAGTEPGHTRLRTWAGGKGACAGKMACNVITSAAHLEVHLGSGPAGPPFAILPLPFPPYCFRRMNLPSGSMQLFNVSIAACALSRRSKVIIPLPFAVPSSFKFTRMPPGAIAPNGENILRR